MQFKVIGKSLVLTNCSHKIIKGENLYDKIEIILPRYHDGIDNSLLSYRLTVVSENGAKSAAAILLAESCTEETIILTDRLNENFSAVAGNVTFILTCIDANGIVGKFSSAMFTINDDLSLDSLPDVNIAEQILNRTHLEAEKAIKASQTPAPAEMYPATTEKLGGVKVDGKTIAALEDGTISVSEAVTNIADLPVQIAHPNNFLIYDKLGKPSVMVAIPKFYLDEVIDGASHTVHPAFIINGIEQNVIYISKYQNIVEDNCAYSLPTNVPKTWVNFEQAWDYCKNKGNGWHLMTNAEWAAVALWCKKNGTMPKGNNNNGKDISETNCPQKAIAATYGGDGKINKTLTGSGGISWNHDGTAAGIADLNGNVFEWNSGIRLNDGEIQILADNNAADLNNSVSSDSALWKAIMPDGSLVPIGTPGTLKYGWKNSKCIVGITLEGKSTEVRHNNFGAIAVDTGAAIPEIIKALALYPADKDGYGENGFYMINTGERLSLRGGNWLGSTNAGLFRLDMDSLRSYSSGGIGFRCCYYNTDQA